MMNEAKLYISDAIKEIKKAIHLIIDKLDILKHVAVDFRKPRLLSAALHLEYIMRDFFNRLTDLEDLVQRKEDLA